MSKRKGKIGTGKVPVRLGILPVLALALAAILMVLPACDSAQTADSTPTGQTFKTLADAGQKVYADQCAVCHGNNGQPANKFTVLLWGPGSTLGTYDGITLFTNAQEMLDYLSKSMPLNASGSLSSLQYGDVMAYILVQANTVSPSTVFDKSKLTFISIP